jgi:hypothetical protein
LVQVEGVGVEFLEFASPFISTLLLMIVLQLSLIPVSRRQGEYS